MERFVIYQGFPNPRKPEEIGWREWDVAPTLRAAKKLIKASGLAIARVEQTKTVFMHGCEIGVEA